MKKLFALLILVLVFVGCTDNERARNWGGTEIIVLDPNRKLVTITWKEDNLWILTEEMPPSYVPQTRVLQEKSSWGTLQGSIVIKETR